MERRRRIVIVEDHVVLRDGLRSLLGREADLEIVGEAGDGLAAIALVRRLRPDLVLMDLSMPKMTGLDAIREIVKRNAQTKVVALTVHKTEEYVQAAFEAGASAYVLKDASSTELIAAIRSVLAGSTFVSPEIRGWTERRPPRGAKRGMSDVRTQVTPRERAVLKLIAEGHRNREIADLLGISVKTVENHRTNLMQKLDLHNAAGLTAFAAKKGLIS